MPLRSIPYDAARPLVRKYLSLEEDPETADLIRELRTARRRGYLRRSELEAICYWKSPRAIQHIKSNSAHAVRVATRAALATRSERARLEALLSLQGVSVPVVGIQQRHQFGDYGPIPRILHTSDIHIGKVFEQFGEFGSQLRGKSERRAVQCLSSRAPSAWTLFFWRGDIFDSSFSPAKIGLNSASTRVFGWGRRVVRPNGEDGMNLLVCSAIRSRKVIQFSYDGYERVVEPFCHGTSTAGNEVLRGFQTGGQSASGAPIGWKLFEVSKMIGLQQTAETFTGVRPGYNPVDSAMSAVHCHV